MYEWKPKDLNDPFKMRKGERIIDLEKYIGLLNKNNIYFITEQYEAAVKKIKNQDFYKESCTTSLAGGLIKPYKGMILAGTTRALNNCQSQNSFSYHPHWVVFLFATLYLRSRKRVNIFLHTNLFCYLIFLNLILNIFCNCNFISSYCINIISSAPKMSISILIF